MKILETKGVLLLSTLSLNLSCGRWMFLACRRRKVSVLRSPPWKEKKSCHHAWTCSSTRSQTMTPDQKCCQVKRRTMRWESNLAIPAGHDDLGRLISGGHHRLLGATHTGRLVQENTLNTRHKSNSHPTDITGQKTESQPRLWKALKDGFWLVVNFLLFIS